MIRIARRPSTTPEGFGLGLELVPLAGAGLLLASFFLVQLALARPEPVEVLAPGEIAFAPRAGSRVLVTVSSAGVVRLDGERVDLGRLRELVLEKRAALPRAWVEVVADPSARASFLLRVVEEIKLAGARDIRLATRMEGARLES